MAQVKLGRPVPSEETFGLVAPILMVKTGEETFQMAEATSFGLGMREFTQAVAKAKKHIASVSAGAFFMNELVKSDRRLPFGGANKSGYGRELTEKGSLAFVNKRRVIWLHVIGASTLFFKSPHINFKKLSGVFPLN